MTGGIELGSWPDWAIVAFTAFLAWLSWRQHELGKRLAADTADSVRIADESAKAAVRMADAMTVSERAYVFLEDTESIVMGGEDYALLRWRNFGKTPALITGIKFKCGPSEGFPDPQDAYEMPMPVGSVIAAGAAWDKGTVKLDAPGAALREQKHVYLSGQITYRDVHGVERRSWFCRLYTGNGFILGLLHQPELNGYT